MIKNLIKRAVRRFGGYFYTKGSLPCGVDWLLDIQRLAPWSLRDPIVCFDVGANIGQTTFEITEGFPQGLTHIYAFEPVISTYTTLCSNVARFNNVSAFQFALGAKEGRLHIKAENGSVFNSLISNLTRGQDDISSEIVGVETIDRFCSKHDIPFIHILKTDTEGFDLEVLKGASALFKANRVSFVYAEVTFCESNKQNTPFAPLAEFLYKNDFCLLGLYETYPLHHFEEPNNFCNALFVSRAARDKAVAAKSTGRA